MNRSRRPWVLLTAVVCTATWGLGPRLAHAQNIEAELRRAKAEDSHIGLSWVLIEGAGGYSMVAPGAISANNLGLSRKAMSGGAWSASLGGRALSLTLSARVRNHRGPELDMWWFDGMVAYRPRWGSFEPYFGLSGGYVMTTRVSDSALSTQRPDNMGAGEVSLRGASVGLSLGADYYFMKYLSAGLQVSGEALVLSRPSVALLPNTKDPASSASQLYGESGSAVGLSLFASVGLSAHF